MFCYQCQETAKNTGCTIKGVCGKPDDVAKLQDVLIHVLKGLAVWGSRALEYGWDSTRAGRTVFKGLFATITNVNFDAERFNTLVQEALQERERVRFEFLSLYKEKTDSEFSLEMDDVATWNPGSPGNYLAKAEEASVLAEQNEDLRSLKELVTYGLKGIAAYGEHAAVLSHEERPLYDFVIRALVEISRKDIGSQELVQLVMDTGKYGVEVMALLDKANTSTYGNPEPTEVNIGVGKRPGILVSGHDLKDFEELLKQSRDAGVDIYTHGEMLPAHGYPAFKKYGHFVGNYGGSWWKQEEEFDKFHGPILMTTNCLVRPRDSYKERLFTTGLVGWEGVRHIPEGSEGKSKDFSALIELAKQCEAPLELETGKVMTGFAHQAVLSQADTLVAAVKSGAIKRFVVMGGCDGRHKTRSYFEDVAKALPQEAVILTAGCAKYRYNKLDLGFVGALPRVIDAGQCNDSYSLAVIALKLKEVFGLEDINELPISFDIAWYEQKAVIVLLALLYLGVKGIRLGPTLPAFLSVNVVKVLVEKFAIKLTANVEQDVTDMMRGDLSAVAG